MSGYLVPGDEAFHDDKQLIADLTTLAGQLGQYVLRMLDADAKRAQPVSASDERAFTQTLRAMVERLEERANRCATPDNSPVLEGDPVRRELTSGHQSARC